MAATREYLNFLVTVSTESLKASVRAASGEVDKFAAKTKKGLADAFSGFGKGLDTGKARAAVRELDGAPFDDRAHIIYAVMKNTDESSLGQFLRDFLADEAARIADPRLAECMDYFKTTEKGETQVCDIMEKLIQKENERVYKIAQWEKQRENVLRMLNNGFDKKAILLALGITDEEFTALLEDKAG